MNAVDDSVGSVLHCAVQKAHWPIAGMLINAGADPIIGRYSASVQTTNIRNAPFLLAMAEKSNLLSKQFFNWCDDPSSCDVTSFDDAAKRLLLRCAALAGSAGLVNHLLSYGVDETELSVFNICPLACAVVGRLESKSFDQLAIQDDEKNNELVHWLAKKYGHVYAKNRCMTLKILALDVVRTYVGPHKRKRSNSRQDSIKRVRFNKLT